MNPKYKRLEQSLYEQVPLAAAMMVTIGALDENAVVLRAPLRPNVNNKSTVFAGSATPVAILAGWSLIHLRLLEEGYVCEIVIQSNRTRFEKPITGDFSVMASLAEGSVWGEFKGLLSENGKSHIEVKCVFECDGHRVGALSASFVGIIRSKPR